jgi:hypothetical protein
MTNKNKKYSRTEDLGEEEIHELLEQAGRRPEIPTTDFRIIKAAAKAEWQQLVESKRSHKRWWELPTPLSAAAGILLVLALAWWWRAETTVPAVQEVATIELFRGDVSLVGEDRQPAVGASLGQDVELLTGAGNGEHADVVSLRLAGGQSLRLDSATRAILTSSSKIDLLEGAVYVDSGPDLPGSQSVEVSTPFGTVSDIGTQFEVRVNKTEGALRIRVRSGSISLVRGQEQYAAAMGEELAIGADGSFNRGLYEVSGTDWDWILNAAPTLDIEGLPLRAFLDWVARETSLQIRYEDDVLAGLVSAIDLHGTIEGLRPDEALVVVLPGTGLGHRIEGSMLFITRLPPGSGGV